MPSSIEIVNTIGDDRCRYGAVDERQFFLRNNVLYRKLARHPSDGWVRSVNVSTGDIVAIGNDEQVRLVDCDVHVTVRPKETQ